MGRIRREDDQSDNLPASPGPVEEFQEDDEDDDDLGIVKEIFQDGKNQFENGDYEDAANAFEEALLELDHIDDRETASENRVEVKRGILASLIESYINLKRFDDAQRVVTDLKALSASSITDSTPDLDHTIAVILFLKGDDLDAARKKCEEVHKKRSEAFGKTDPTVYKSVDLKAAILDAQGRHRTADIWRKKHLPHGYASVYRPKATQETMEVVGESTEAKRESLSRPHIENSLPQSRTHVMESAAISPAVSESSVIESGLRFSIAESSSSVATEPRDLTLKHETENEPRPSITKSNAVPSAVVNSEKLENIFKTVWKLTPESAWLARTADERRRKVQDSDVAELIENCDKADVLIEGGWSKKAGDLARSYLQRVAVQFSVFGLNGKYVYVYEDRVRWSNITENVTNSTGKGFAGTGSGQSLLHKLSEYGLTRLVEVLLDRGAHIDALDEKLATPLLYACFNGSFETARLLLSRGARPGRQSKQGLLPIHAAIVIGDNDTLAALLAAMPNENKEMLEHKIANGSTPLHLAATIYDRPSLTETLLAHGASFATLDNERYSPLHRAVKAGNLEIAKILIKYGANPDDHRPWEWTVAPTVGCGWLAACNGHAHLLPLFTDHRSGDYYSRLGIHHAADSGYSEVVKELLKPQYQVPLDAKDSSGWTALHFAANAGHLICVDILLSNGYNKLATAHRGETPAQLARKSGHKYIAQTLEPVNKRKISFLRAMLRG